MTLNVLADFKKALATPNQLLADDIVKSFTQSGSATSGLTFYDLEAPAKLLYPVLTPLRNRIARVTGGKGIQANWRAITGINTSGVSLGLSEGNRNAAIAHTTQDYLAIFRFMGLDDFVTFESDFAAEGFDDVKARAVEGLLRATMIGEEMIDLGGNTSVLLGTTPTPTLSGASTGGTLAAGTWYVQCVALTLDGYNQLAGWNNGLTGQSLNLSSAVLNATVSRTNMNGVVETISGGVAQVSAAASVTTSGGTSSIGASVTVVPGAVAYAWFWGTSGSIVLGAVSTINSVSITAAATGTQNVTTLPAADNSTNSLVYDGLLTQIMKPGSGAYFQSLATGTPGTGTKMTSDSAGGVVEINNALSSFWNNYRLGPDEMFVNAAQLLELNTLIIAGGGAPLYRFQIDGANPVPKIDAGVVVGSYLNKITGTKIQITVHPNIPPGTILFWSNTIPYPLSNVGNLVQKRLRRDYYQIQWPIQRRRYEYGVYFDGVLQNYFPPAFGVLNNIA